MSINKNRLRKIYKEKRAQVSLKCEKDISVLNNTVKLSERYNLGSFFVYVSMNSEVDTRLLIRYWLANEKNVCIPRTKNGIMSVIMLENLPSMISVDKLGNLCGSENHQVPCFECDCAIIPLLAFNDELYRIGYGGGYYDRFLETFKGIKIGLAYDEQFCNCFERESHDIRLDYIVTPTKIYGGESCV